MNTIDRELLRLIAELDARGTPLTLGDLVGPEPTDAERAIAHANQRHHNLRRQIESWLTHLTIIYGENLDTRPLTAGEITRRLHHILSRDIA